MKEGVKQAGMFCFVFLTPPPHTHTLIDNQEAMLQNWTLKRGASYMIAFALADLC